MDPITETQWLVRWRETELHVESPADPSLRQLREDRLRMESLLRKQSEETKSILRREGRRIAEALMAPAADIGFEMPDTVVCPGGRDGKDFAADVPAEFRRQRVGGFLNRVSGGDIHAAFRNRLSQLENCGYSGVQTGANLLRFAAAREIVLLLPAQEPAAGIQEAVVRDLPAFPSPQDGESLRACLAPEDPGEQEVLRSGYSAVRRLHAEVARLHQAVSVAAYMYADEEYQAKRAILLTRLIAIGRALAHREMRGIVRTIWRRALENDLNRGLSLSVPYFDDRLLDMALLEVEVVPPGRTMFVPAFVVLASRREQERIEQRDSLSPSTRVHLLAELKSLEQAFDGRPQ